MEYKDFGMLLLNKIAIYEECLKDNNFVHKEEIIIKLKELKDIYEMWDVTFDLKLQRLYPDYYIGKINEVEAKDLYYSQFKE